ncbi:MAG: alpha/beta family hydrolase, partial [bacterium]
PMLFIQGTHDAFARRDLLARVLERLPSATLHPVDGADHGLKIRGRTPVDVTDEIVSAITRWIRGVA